jgi:5-methylcytosine-specific restriction enzyme subunit McrC
MSLQPTLDDTEFEADIQLAEYEESAPVELSQAAGEMLTNEINGGDERDGDRIRLRYTREGKAVLTATQYVGVVSLRDGPTIQVTPKAAGTNLLSLLRYAHNTSATTFESQTQYQQGQTFFDALGSIYETELRRVLNRGLHTDYKRVSGTEQHLKGQLDLQRQLQRQPPTPSVFECTYDELTHDITANRAILYATSLLLGLVSDRSITQSLRQHQQILRRRVELTPVTVQGLDGIQLTRLSEYYEDILRLARLVIGNAFVGELQAGQSASFAMLVNMNTIFEQVVERAVSEVLSDHEGWRAEAQEQSQSLLTSGRHMVTLKPDITVYDSAGTVRLVADAKWKTMSPTNADFYQLTSYMLANDAPGLLVYPDCDGETVSESEVAGKFSLSLIELPTASNRTSHEDYIHEIEDTIHTELSKLFDRMS